MALIVASRCVPAASRCVQAEKMQIYAPGYRPRYVPLCCWLVNQFMQIAANQCKSIVNRFPLLLVASRYDPAASRCAQAEQMQIHAPGYRPRYVPL